MMVERAHAEEAEQEQRAKLLRSRNKKEDDPEKEKKKKDAKMKQQALQEAEQQKQADETALEASRRKPRNAAQVNKTFFCYLTRVTVNNQATVLKLTKMSKTNYFREITFFTYFLIVKIYFLFAHSVL
jgi:hypothetical protein